MNTEIKYESYSSTINDLHNKRTECSHIVSNTTDRVDFCKENIHKYNGVKQSYRNSLDFDELMIYLKNFFKKIRLNYEDKILTIEYGINFSLKFTLPI